MAPKLPRQRWLLHPSQPQKVEEIVAATGLSSLMAQVVINRGFDTPELARVYLEPDLTPLPPPLEEFPDLAKSVNLLQEAIATRQKIVICGDYDADGMTSTALLLRALRHLGADVSHAIPSRMSEGYGINQRIVRDCKESDVGIILTVDNGIAAYQPIALAVELGIKVIITDHHDLPEKLPPADAILNPKLLPETSPYKGLAGVGVAYILALTTAQSIGKEELKDQFLELFTLGTIADLAPLTGVNRYWVKKGLKKLPLSQLEGVQALIQVSGVNEEKKQLHPDDIGFRIGPRINAVGRIGEPQLVIDLLTTDDTGLALERAMQCEQYNRKRQDLCQIFEQEAVKMIENIPINWHSDRVLVVVNSKWHHGVIGIVASRLVERYGVPVFIATYEAENPEIIRGSARGIEEFNVFDALLFCDELLDKYGGHKAAGGFSLPAKNLESFKDRLRTFAHQKLKPEHLKPLIIIDTQADFKQLNKNLCQQIESLQPWGIGNPFPVFWTPNVRLVEQRKLNQKTAKFILAQDDGTKVEAISWNWAQYLPFPNRLDIAYLLKENSWNGNNYIQLEMVGVRLPASNQKEENFVFEYKGRSYNVIIESDGNQLRINNNKGEVLVVNKGARRGIITKRNAKNEEVDVTKPYYYHLIKMAVAALNLSPGERGARGDSSSSK